MTITRPIRTPVRRRLVVGLVTCGLVATAGCYDGDTLVERVRNRAIRTRLEEVDLGDYRVTLPRDEQSGSMTEIEVRLYGESQRHKINEIEAEVEEKSALIEDNTLASLREVSGKELAEPDLTQLRSRLLATMNGILENAPLRAIGFHHIRVIRH